MSPRVDVADATAVSDVVAAGLRDVPDFPQPGVVFKDITPLLADPHAFAWDLLVRVGAEVVAFECVVELAMLGGRERLGGRRVGALHVVG